MNGVNGPKDSAPIGKQGSSPSKSPSAGWRGRTVSPVPESEASPTALKAKDISKNNMSEDQGQTSSSLKGLKTSIQESDLHSVSPIMTNTDESILENVLRIIDGPEWKDNLGDLYTYLDTRGENVTNFFNSPEVKQRIIQLIKDDLSKLNTPAENGLDARLVYLRDLFNSFYKVGQGYSFVLLIDDPQLQPSLPPLFQGGIAENYWQLLFTLCSYCDKEGKDLIQAAKENPDGFSKGRFYFGNRWYSIIAQQDEMGHVSFSLSVGSIGQGTFKKAKFLFSLGEKAVNSVKLNPVSRASSNSLTEIDEKEGKFRKEVEKEVGVSKELRQRNVPYILSLRKVTYAGASGVQKVRCLSEVCTSGDLFKNFFQRQPPLSQVEKLKLMSQVCEALAGMHEAGLCHLDLKLANVFVTKNHDSMLEVRLADFGAAKNVQDSVGLTATFPPPEMLLGKDIPVETAIDSWALGIMLYEATHGTSGSSLCLDWSSGVHDRKSYNKGIEKLKKSLAEGSELDQIIGRMLSANPKERATPLEAFQCIQKMLDQESHKNVFQTSPNAISSPQSQDDVQEIKTVDTESITLSESDSSVDAFEEMSPLDQEELDNLLLSPEEDRDMRRKQ